MAYIMSSKSCWVKLKLTAQQIYLFLWHRRFPRTLFSKKIDFFTIYCCSFWLQQSLNHLIFTVSFVLSTVLPASWETKMAANATEPMNKELRTATRRENQRSQATTMTNVWLWVSWYLQGDISAIMANLRKYCWTAKSDERNCESYWKLFCLNAIFYQV